jgi:hypothetical protein
MWDKCEGGCNKKVLKVSNRKYCPECAKRISVEQSIKSKRERGYARRSLLPPTFPCPYCEKTVPLRRSDQVTCGDKACIGERSRQYNTRRYAEIKKNGGPPAREPFLCVCGKKVTPRQSTQKSCGNSACYLKIWNMGSNALLLGSVFVECGICKKKVRRRDKRQVTCLAKACQAKHQANILADYRHRQLQLSAMAQTTLMVDSIKEASRNLPADSSARDTTKKMSKKIPGKHPKKNPVKESREDIRKDISRCRNFLMDNLMDISRQFLGL